MEMPGGDPSTCISCVLKLDLSRRELFIPSRDLGGYQARRTRRRSKGNLPKQFLNALHTRKISPVEARDIYGIEIEEDPLKRAQGKRWG